MANFRYLVLDAQGLNQQGVIQADDVAHAGILLRAKQFYVVRIDAENTDDASDVMAWINKRLSPNTSALTLFFRQMSMMLKSGLTLTQALETTTQTQARSSMGYISLDLVESISGGSKLSEALSKHPKTFNRLVVELVKSAETSGELDSVMNRIADDMERTADLKRQFVTALTYPGVVFLTAIGVAAFLVLAVVPKFAQFFQKTGRSLPPTTQALVDITDFITHWGLYVGAALVASFIALSISWQRPETRPKIDSVLLKIPVIGNIILTANVSQFTWASAMLLSSGVTLIETLRVVKNVVGNAAISQAIGFVEEDILAGHGLSEALKKQKVFPPLVAQLAGVGERTGNLDDVMESLGNFYQRMLAATIKLLTSLIEPAMILVVGGMVGFVYYAFFSALFSVSG